MALSRLSLTDFRNHQSCLIDGPSNLVVLTGENGAGKTNVLEAISLLSPGRGLRSATLVDMARKNGGGGFGVSARIGDVSLGTGCLATSPNQRLVRINGAQNAATALSEWVSVIWLTPAMDRLFVEGASERRRFLDRLVLAIAPNHARHATRYEAAMRQRNRLLSDDARADPQWLAALETQMAEHGLALASARAELVEILNEQLGVQAEGPFARATLAIEGWEASGDFAGELAASRPKDGAAGRTLVGPHRNDLSVAHVGKNQSAAQCSTGEQKALLLAILLAHVDLVASRISRRPILLLDEIAAHLDSRRRAALFERLRQGGGQVWMTGTDRSFFAEISPAATQLFVSAGSVNS